MLRRVEVVRQRVASIREMLQEVAPNPQSRGDGDFAEALESAGRPQTPARPTRAATAGDFDTIIRDAAEDTGVSEDLIHAVIRAESDYNPTCRSSAGAMGLMQLMPGTARALGVSNPWDPAQNVMGGARYLSEQLDRFGDRTLALAAYNAGPGAVQRYDGVPPYDETQTYVRRVERYLQERVAPAGE